MTSHTKQVILARRLTAKTYLITLRAAGPRWAELAGIEPGGTRYLTTTPQVSQDALSKLQQWVLDNDPTLDELEREADRVASETVR